MTRTPEKKNEVRNWVQKSHGSKVEKEKRIKQNHCKNKRNKQTIYMRLCKSKYISPKSVLFIFWCCFFWFSELPSASRTFKFQNTREFEPDTSFLTLEHLSVPLTDDRANLGYIFQQQVPSGSSRMLWDNRESKNTWSLFPCIEGCPNLSKGPDL